ncbi:MAG: dTDP-4-dehydrorhamnose reductase [Bacteroidetes bacterium]|nr:dTDP-4-dehydrorhamnose reductase [Bacteroidota bacterium]
MPDKIMIAGARGLLGQKTVEVFKRESEYDLIPCELTAGNEGVIELDITNRQKVAEAVGTFKPSVIINAAAFTDVDRAEVEKETAYKVNASAVEHLAEAANIFNAKLVHISTDYVFNGQKGNYAEDSLPDPLGYYGRSKLAGENLAKSRLDNLVILRTQVLYGFGKGIKKNFVLWVLDKLSSGDKFSVVTDQIGNPTLADELAFAVLKAVQKNAVGLYHVSGLEAMSRHEFAVKIAEVFGFDPSVISTTTSDTLNQKAKRPMNSSFICLKAQTELGINMPTVKDSLSLMKQQMKHAGMKF